MTTFDATEAVFTPTLEAQAQQVAYHYEALVHEIAHGQPHQAKVTAAELGQALGQFMNSTNGVVDTEAATMYFTTMTYLSLAEI